MKDKPEKKNEKLENKAQREHYENIIANLNVGYGAVAGLKPSPKGSLEYLTEASGPKFDWMIPILKAIYVYAWGRGYGHGTKDAKEEQED